MADEIEKHLVTKLKQAIAEVKAAAEQHFPAKLAHLSSKFDQVQKSLDDRSTSGAPNLPKLSRPTLYTLTNLLSEWQIHFQTQTPYSIDSLIFIGKFATNLNKIKSELRSGDGASVATSNGETTQSSSGGEIEGLRWSDRSVDETKVHGLDDRVMSLQRILVPGKDDAGFKAIAIVGMRGVGKTTLCQLIFKKEGARKYFLPRIWVCASRRRGSDPADMREEIVKRMLACLGVEDEIVKAAADSHGLKGLLFALRLELMGKKYLIVLDDVWIPKDRRNEFCDFCSFLDGDEKCGEKLAYGLPKGYGGRVIVTSRSEDLGMKMVGEENLNRMLPVLDDESCWKIFKDSAGEDEKQWETLRGKIVEKCAGLPLAAKMMGQIARESISKQPAPAAPENYQDESHQESQAQPTN